jgi:hypothetical protein
VHLSRTIVETSVNECRRCPTPQPVWLQALNTHTLACCRRRRRDRRRWLRSSSLRTPRIGRRDSSSGTHLVSATCENRTPLRRHGGRRNRRAEACSCANAGMRNPSPADPAGVLQFSDAPLWDRALLTRGATPWRPLLLAGSLQAIGSKQKRPSKAESVSPVGRTSTLPAAEPGAAAPRRLQKSTPPGVSGASAGEQTRADVSAAPGSLAHARLGPLRASKFRERTGARFRPSSERRCAPLRTTALISRRRGIGRLQRRQRDRPGWGRSVSRRTIVFAPRARVRSAGVARMLRSEGDRPRDSGPSLMSGRACRRGA